MEAAGELLTASGLATIRAQSYSWTLARLSGVIHWLTGFRAIPGPKMRGTGNPKFLYGAEGNQPTENLWAFGRSGRRC